MKFHTFVHARRYFLVRVADECIYKNVEQWSAWKGRLAVFVKRGAGEEKNA